MDKNKILIIVLTIIAAVLAAIIFSESSNIDVTLNDGESDHEGFVERGFRRRGSHHDELKRSSSIREDLTLDQSLSVRVLAAETHEPVENARFWLLKKGVEDGSLPIAVTIAVKTDTLGQAELKIMRDVKVLVDHPAFLPYYFEPVFNGKETSISLHQGGTVRLTVLDMDDLSPVDGIPLSLESIFDPRLRGMKGPVARANSGIRRKNRTDEFGRIEFKGLLPNESYQLEIIGDDYCLTSSSIATVIKPESPEQTIYVRRPWCVVLNPVDEVSGKSVLGCSLDTSSTSHHIDITPMPSVALPSSWRDANRKARIAHPGALLLTGKFSGSAGENDEVDLFLSAPAYQAVKLNLSLSQIIEGGILDIKMTPFEGTGEVVFAPQFADHTAFEDLSVGLLVVSSSTGKKWPLTVSLEDLPTGKFWPIRLPADSYFVENTRKQVEFTVSSGRTVRIPITVCSDLGVFVVEPTIGDGGSVGFCFATLLGPLEDEAPFASKRIVETDRFRRCRVSWRDLAPGRYIAGISRPGYQNWRTEVQVVAGAQLKRSPVLITSKKK